MGARVHLDTAAAHKALDELLEKVKSINAQNVSVHADTDINPAKVAQAQKRWDRRNGRT